LDFEKKIKKISKNIVSTLSHNFGVSVQNASFDQIYKSIALVLQNFLIHHNNDFIDKVQKEHPKQIHYLCMEFLLGKSLKNNLFNLKLEDVFSKALLDLGINIDDIYKREDDAALGNGGLGRLAACFLDSLASQNYPAIGYSLRYEYGIFKQKLIDGWQTELPDFWLSKGSPWLTPCPEDAVVVKFDGKVIEKWGENFHEVEIKDANEVIAMPYDMIICGFEGKGMSKLRLWSAESRGFNMELFNNGNYMKAVEQDAMAGVITKVLYPCDNHTEGKSLRLSQQYFLVSATIQDIVKKHLKTYHTLDNLSSKAAIHLNDTHPVLAIPELMRIMLDECSYTWDNAFKIVKETFAYTNHTVMSEALEIWSTDLLKRRLPRIFQIINEINNRFVYSLKCKNIGSEQIDNMSIVNRDMICMPNLAIACSHSVNGVSELHSNILKNDVFKDFYSVTPEKFKNVTNGITHRRWLSQANPLLSNFISDLIGSDFISKPLLLNDLLKYENDSQVLDKLQKIKYENKILLSKYIKNQTGIIVDPSSIFDTQIKRFHEYKRQLLNALEILDTYIYLKNNPQINFFPKTFIFAGKAASNYYFAKQIIKLIYKLGEIINGDISIKDKMKVVFLEDYSVSLAEKIIPASDISEQISLAGTEASGTSNMKFMLNGALTLGTMDGANVEIYENVGENNIFIFGLKANEVENLKKTGYNPMSIYNNNCAKMAIEQLTCGVGNSRFEEIANYLLTRDSFMVLADFSDYQKARRKISDTYINSILWNRMSLVNIAKSGVFSSDNSIKNYADEIWNLKPLL